MEILLEQKWLVHLSVAILLGFYVESRENDSGRRKSKGKQARKANANSDVSTCNAENLSQLCCVDNAYWLILNR